MGLLATRVTQIYLQNAIIGPLSIITISIHPRSKCPSDIYSDGSITTRLLLQVTPIMAFDSYTALLYL